MKDPLLKLLKSKARFSNTELAEALSLQVDAVNDQISQWEGDGTILGYQAVIDDEKAGEMGVAAFIVHGTDPIGMKEKALLFLFAFVAIALLGPGKHSVDRK